MAEPERETTWRATCLWYGTWRRRAAVRLRAGRLTRANMDGAHGVIRRERVIQASWNAVAYACLSTPEVCVWRPTVGRTVVARLPQRGADERTLVAYPTISPCGLRLAFSARDAANGRSWVYSCYMDGSHLQATAVRRWPFYYLWSPNSRYLTWLGDSDVGGRIGLRVRGDGAAAGAHRAWRWLIALRAPSGRSVPLPRSWTWRDGPACRSCRRRSRRRGRSSTAGCQTRSASS